MFWPFRLHDTHQFCFDTPFEEHYIGENKQLHGLYFPGEGETKGLVLYLHGNSKNLQYWGQFAKDFVDRGYSVFAIDYSGYGKSKGVPSQEKMFQDACVAYEWVSNCMENDNIILYGRSLGAAVAAHLASQNEAKMLIMETPFYCMKSVFQDKAPFLFLPLELENDFSNYQYLPQIDMPVHLIHGTRDELVSFQKTQELIHHLKADDSFTVIQGGRHKNLNTFAEYHNKLDSLLVY